MQDLLFWQLFDSETSTYTYLLADEKSKQAAIIDPVFSKVERDFQLVTELGLQLCFTLETHIHADHITGSGELRKRTNAKIALSSQAGASGVDLPLNDGDKLNLGEHNIKAIATPGHTDGCMSYYADGRVFTGDALLIRKNGRTDFQQGSPEKLFGSIREKLYKLPPETLVYPGHDYNGRCSSSIWEERKFNSRISESHSLNDFVKTMNGLNLAPPKKLDIAVPANLCCGTNLPETQPKVG